MDDNIVATFNNCSLVSSINCETLSAKYVDANNHFSFEVANHVYSLVDCYNATFVSGEV